MKRFLTLPAAAVAGAAALSSPAAAECVALFDDARQPAAMDGYSVFAESNKPGLMDPPPLPDGATGLLCVRDTPVPAPNDYEVLLHGVSFVVRDGDAEPAVSTALGVEEGQFTVRVIEGEITPDQREAIVARLEGFYEAYAALQAEDGAEGG